MRFYTELPKLYGGKILDLPIFDNNQRITNRTRTAVENTLYLYREFSKKHSVFSENNPNNYKVENIFVVGSGVKNKIDSDLDLLLVTPKLDLSSADNLKLLISYVLFCDRPKQEARDVFIRPEDKYPQRNSFDITCQIKNILDSYKI